MIHKIFAVFKSFLPKWITNPVRSIGTAFLTPLNFSLGSGHFLSSFMMSAVSRNLKPIPWYTYPSIAFLEGRIFKEDRVLEFGGGQSSIWWAQRALKVITFEGNDPLFSPSHEWAKKLRKKLPENVDLYEISMESSEICTSEVREVLESKSDSKFNVIVIDGLYRKEMVPIALDYLEEDGMVIVDNAEGYEMYEAFLNSDLKKVEFYGYSPGVYLKSCTAIYFRSESKYFSNLLKINEPN